MTGREAMVSLLDTLRRKTYGEELYDRVVEVPRVLPPDIRATVALSSNAAQLVVIYKGACYEVGQVQMVALDAPIKGIRRVRLEVLVP